MTAPSVVSNLVKRFSNDIGTYRSGAYNETQLRVEFLNPLFEALGWDVFNKKNSSRYFKEVIHEDSIKVAGRTKAPDYCFRAAGGVRSFFVEAKKPSVDIQSDVNPAFQLRRYGWSAKLPVSILTDFEEFAVYDCRVKPQKNDRASVARIKYFRYDEYDAKWDELYGTFSPEAVRQGSLDSFLESPRQRDTVEVDDAFLDEIKRWRQSLAHNVALRNPHLSQRELNFAVQQTIDRIVFLRICEDRGIEPYENLKLAAQTTSVYSRLSDLFRRADDRYNSGLFHFSESRDQAGAPDKLTLSLTIDDGVLRNILGNLYYPDSPYEFSVFPTEILGQVYEQFLGQIIRLTPSHRAVVEDKPEVKKAGGVYYTPTYVVDYIVRGTIGEVTRDKTPRQVSSLKILDPACGSGSFLIGAYRYLLDWHRDWYITDGPKIHSKGRRPRLVRTVGGDWKLTTAERKRILLTNIFGVDIDPQAVEVSKLSLLLKVLEGESEESIAAQMGLFQQRVLPDLAANIKCGNSLISPDYFSQHQRSFLDEEELFRINAFDWNAEFPDVLARKNPGFDVVIGNPPYRRELGYKDLLDEIASSEFGRRFRSARMDLWYYFVHKGLELLRKDGLLSFIVNAYWMAGTGAEKLIEAFRTDAHVQELFFLGPLRVFRKISGQHIIFRVANSNDKSKTKIRTVPRGAKGDALPYFTGRLPVEEYYKKQAQLFHRNKVDLQPPSEELLEKLAIWPPLETMGIVRQGIAENPASINRKTNARFGNRWIVGEGVFALNRSEVAKLELQKDELDLLRPYHDLCDLDRYWRADDPSLTLIYSNKDTCPSLSRYPRIKKHLTRFRPVMEQRRETKKGSNSWWHLHWPRDERIFQAPKIVCLQMAPRPSFVPAREPTYVPFSVNVFVPSEDTHEDLNYIAAILNSRLMWKWFQHHAKRRGVGLEINGHVLCRCPIRRIDFTDPAERAIHNEITEQVQRMLDLVRNERTAKTDYQKTALVRQIVATDAIIENLVYELYALTDEEIRGIVGATTLPK